MNYRRLNLIDNLISRDKLIIGSLTTKNSERETKMEETGKKQNDAPNGKGKDNGPKRDKLRESLGKKILHLFGRVPGKFLALTETIIMESLSIDAGKVQWAMSPLIDGGKIAALTDPQGNVIYVVRNLRSKQRKIFRYKSSELVSLLNKKYFDDVGKFIEKRLTGSKYILADRKFLERFDDELGMPIELLRQAILCFADAGLIKWTKEGKLSYTSDGKSSFLNYYALKSAFISQRFFRDVTFLLPKRARIDTLADVEKVHEEHDERVRADVLPASTAKQRVKFMNLAELLAGHQDFDIKFLNQIFARLAALPQEERPDIMIISGLVQGSFQHRQKNRRLTLVQGLESEMEQFRIARFVIDECRKLGIKVIYNRGNDDREICEMHTYDALLIMANQSKPQKDSAKKTLNYKQLDDLKQTKAWLFHHRFQWDVVFPYMLRSGRRLYSADEVGKKFGQRIEEYLMLLETHYALVNNLPVPDPFYAQVLAVDNIPLPGKEFGDFRVTADFDLKVGSPDNPEFFMLWEKHNFNLTPTTMQGDSLKVARAIMGQLKAMSNKAPNALIIEHQQQPAGVLEDETLIVSLPGMHSAHLKRGSFVSEVQIDPSRRKLTTRRELFTAGACAITWENHRYLIDFYNEALLKKAGSLKERTVVALLSDWQTGSVTMRPDLQVKALDYILHEVMAKYPTYLAFAGDIFQGRNYPEMPNENVRMGLVRTYDQQEFDRRMLLNSLRSSPLENLLKLQGVKLAAGNHEVNTSHKMTGDTHMGFLTCTLRDFMDYHNLSIPVTYCDKLATENGEHFNAYAGVQNVGDYNVLIQHMIMERGGKGSGGGLPAAQAKTLIEGTGKLLRNIDIILTGHWHEPNYCLVNNKLAVVNGSLAGLSGYEYQLGYRPTMGTVLIHLGAGLPPTLEIVTAKMLMEYSPKGYYSDANLAKLGFTTDKGFNPRRHGFSLVPGEPQSAIQKSLWSIVDDINWKLQSTLK